MLYQALCAARDAYDDGERDPDKLRFITSQAITRRTLSQIEYISLADNVTLAELDKPIEAPALLSLVVKFGKTRLLDNIELG